MVEITKVENWCAKHFRERILIYTNEKERIIVDIVRGGADLVFGMHYDLIDLPDCKAPNCTDKADYYTKRIDHYDRIPEMPKV